MINYCKDLQKNKYLLTIKKHTMYYYNDKIINDHDD